MNYSLYIKNNLKSLKDKTIYIYYQNMNQLEIKNRFSNSKVYKLICNITGLIYVGSTTQELHTRLSEHKSTYKAYLADKSKKYYTSFEIIKNCDFDIKLIKAYDFENKHELLAKEGYWVKKLNCANKQIPGRTKAEYRADNKEEINAKNRLYNNQNKIKIAAQKKTVCICACGCEYTKSHKLRHLESKKHIKLMQKINPLQIP